MEEGPHSLLQLPTDLVKLVASGADDSPLGKFVAVLAGAAFTLLYVSLGREMEVIDELERL